MEDINDYTTGLVAHKAPESKSGGCNFCTRHASTVWVLESRDEMRNNIIRLCPTCLKELKAATK